MSVERVRRKSGLAYRVRWRESGRNRARTFDARRDAELFEGEIRRRRQLGDLALWTRVRRRSMSTSPRRTGACT